ncbi:putative flagellar hook-length control protein FliK [Candidatus Megaera venefica]|uniref:Flagellar hook-length control protein FliK n=1 Tax=Candidatus Megaera venefica TaxID=2055910 RepID=A0ABU5NBM8_9RICK|nr:hypothetical protein [Candidatus Megaera venefica]MEA0970590.1 putative flagellar hook-length control protein FliK [Candidatus Megaera venefica]
MATAVLEQHALGSSEADRGKKQSLSTTKNHGAGEFADLIKDRPKLIYSSPAKAESAQKTDKNLQNRQKLSESEQLKIVGLKRKLEEPDQALESMVVATMINQPSQIPLAPLSDESEFALLGEDDILGQEFAVPVINIITKAEDDLSMVITKPELVISESMGAEVVVASSLASSDNIKENIVVAATNDKDSVSLSGQDSLIISELSSQEQSLIQSLKSFKLPEGFSNDFGSNKNLNRAQEENSNQFVSNERSVAQNAGILLKSAVVENSQPIKDPMMAVGEDVSNLIAISSNLLLADETRQGQSVLAKMNKNLESESKISSVIQDEPKLNLESQDNFSGLEQDAGESSAKKYSVLDSFGGTLEVNSEDLFQVSFRENTLNLGTKNLLPKPDMQISLAVKEVLSVSSNAGKKEITINLFPEALGPVKVEILSVLGENGARKIESIKVMAEKRETLEILEKSRMDLEKNLKEVTNTKEEASLQFEMNHQGKGSSGAYFNSTEERDNWMNNFVGLVAEEDSTNALMEYDGQSSGYITEDSINIKV